MQTQANILILSPNMHDRIQIEQYARLSGCADLVVGLSTLEAGRQIVAGDQHFDIVYLSQNFGSTHIRNFMTAARTILNCRDATFVLILENSGLFESDPSHLVLKQTTGVDQVMIRRLSPSELQSHFEISDTLKRERAARREIVALKYLIHELREHINDLAKLQRRGAPASITRLTLTEMCGVLRDLSQAEQTLYFEALLSVFDEQSSVPAAVSSATRIDSGALYGGEIKRLRALTANG